MNYELAKKLKDAGFPQKESMALLYPDNNHLQDIRTWVRVPDLEEIIEACGDGFDDLTKIQGGFCCNKLSEAFKPNPRLTGSTPLEAVANLWLAIKNK